jgi:hypothetical protein
MLDTRQILQRGEQFVSDALVVPRPFPEQILDRVKNASHWLRQGAGVSHANRQQHRPAVLLLRRVVGGLDLKAHHLALGGGVRQQRHHRVRRADLPVDFPCPIDAKGNVPVDENGIAARKQAPLQHAQQVFIRGGMALVKQDDTRQRTR